MIDKWEIQNSQTMSVRQKCHKYHAQECHRCDDFDCGDNTNIPGLKAEVRRLRDENKNLREILVEWLNKKIKPSGLICVDRSAEKARE